MDKSRTGAIGEVLHPMTATATALGRRGREIRGAETSVCVRMRRFARQQAAAKRRLIGTKEKGCLGEHHTRKGFQPAVLQSPAAPRAATRVACNRVKEGEKTPGSMMKKRRQISRGDEGQNRREAAENAEQLIDRRCEAKADSENPDEPVPTDRKQVPATPVKAAATMPSSGTKVASVSQEKQVKTSHGVVGPHRKQSGSGSFQKRESEEAGSERAARCSSRSHSAGRTERTRTEEEDMSREDERRRKAVERKSGAPNEERTGRSRRKTRSVATHAAGGACGSWSRYFDGEPEGVQSEPGHHQPGHQGDADAEKESGNRKNVQENSIAPLRRYNPRRACRDRRGMTPCGLEWTKHLIAMAKEQAFDITWSMEDSPSLRRLLVVRPEKKPGVGMGLFLVQPLLSCSCAIWEETQRHYARQGPKKEAKKEKRNPSGTEVDGGIRQKAGPEEGQGTDRHLGGRKDDLWTTRREEGPGDRSRESSVEESRKENIREKGNSTVRTGNLQVLPRLLTSEPAAERQIPEGKLGFRQRARREGGYLPHLHKYQRRAEDDPSLSVLPRIELGTGLGAKKTREEAVKQAEDTATKDGEDSPSSRCIAGPSVPQGCGIRPPAREISGKQSTGPQQETKGMGADAKARFDLVGQAGGGPVPGSSCSNLALTGRCLLRNEAGQNEHRESGKSGSPGDDGGAAPTPSTATDSSRSCVYQNSASAGTSSVGAQKGGGTGPSEKTEDNKRTPVLPCGCGGGNGGFRMLCFRGDVVLSAFNDCRLKNLSTISAAETDLIYCPQENPGIEPSSHLSPAFTLASLNIPFTFQLQAHPYLKTDLADDVKAVFGNHYCARHCQGFFDIHQGSAPCIVTRPGGEIPSGPFGVFYGWRGTRSYPCGQLGCNHVCSPQCKCYDEEAAWRAAWRRHQRMPVPE